LARAAHERSAVAKKMRKGKAKLYNKKRYSEKVLYFKINIILFKGSNAQIDQTT